MEYVYKILFVGGLVYTVATTLLGTIFDAFNIGGDIDLDGDIPLLNIFRPITVAAFITVFGGVGLIGVSNGINKILNFCIALVSGLIVLFLINRFIVIPLHKVEKTSSAPTNADLIGCTATVISTIFENGFGTISYSFKGNKYNSPARHLYSEEIKKGEKVVICEIKGNIFYVVPLGKISEAQSF